MDQAQVPPGKIETLWTCGAGRSEGQGMRETSGRMTKGYAHVDEKGTKKQEPKKE
jgi:hypothetical protein